MRLLHHVRSRASSAAVEWEGRPFTWAMLDDLSHCMAEGLRARGLERGDRVAVMAPSSIELVGGILAAHRAGFVLVPINPGYQAEERDHILTDSGARLLLLDHDLRALAEGPAPVREHELPRPADPALLIYTSGTTGKSKGCVLTFHNIEAAVGALADLWELGPHDEVVHALPLFHVHGLCVALQGALWTGARTRLLPAFVPSAVVAAFAAGATVFMGVPTMYRRLLAYLDEDPTAAAHLARGRLFCSGSAALSATDFATFAAKTGHRILERYGMSETLITLSNPLHGERRPGAVGRPIPGVEVRVVEDELWVRGPGVMQGYWRNPAATERAFCDGWLKTGDLVRVDGDGYVHITGRASTDILKVGGYKISTREIEDQLARVPGIREVAVVGIPDEEWGQRVVAVVSVEPFLQAMPEAELLHRLQESTHLQAAKKPRAVWVVDELPRNAMGKVLKAALAPRAAAALAGPRATG